MPVSMYVCMSVCLKHMSVCLCVMSEGVTDSFVFQLPGGRGAMVIKTCTTRSKVSKVRVLSRSKDLVGLIKLNRVQT